MENIEIKKIAAEGKSIAYVEDKVLFVPNTVPGDIVDVQVTRKRKSFLRDGDRYYLQCRTAHDGRVRSEHAALYGVTLPMTNPFCEELCPPNRWNCRCTVAQVRRSRYQATPYDEAMALGKQALRCDSFANLYLYTAKINSHSFSMGFFLSPYHRDKKFYE